jgi:hypothetical protein
VSSPTPFTQPDFSNDMFCSVKPMQDGLAVSPEISLELCRPACQNDADHGREENVPPDSEIARRLYLAAFRHAQGLGYHFGDGADQLMHSWANQAIPKIHQKSPPRPAEEVIQEAELAFMRFVAEMINSSYDIDGYRQQHPHAIGELTLAQAQKRLCPIWPIC